MVTSNRGHRRRVRRRICGWRTLIYVLLLSDVRVGSCSAQRGSSLNGFGKGAHGAQGVWRLQRSVFRASTTIFYRTAVSKKRQRCRAPRGTLQRKHSVRSVCSSPTKVSDETRNETGGNRRPKSTRGTLEDRELDVAPRVALEVGGDAVEACDEATDVVVEEGVAEQFAGGAFAALETRHRHVERVHRLAE